MEAGRSEGICGTHYGDGLGLAKAGKREELEVPVAVFAGRFSVTWKCILVCQLVFSKIIELSESVLKRELITRNQS